MQTARSVSHSGKTLRWYLSFRPVAVIAAAFATILSTGLVAGSFAGTASAATSHALSTTGLGYTALPTPVRIADTRAGAVDPATYAGKTLAAGASQLVDIPATSGVPINAGAVVVNVTAVNPSASGFLTVSPGGSAGSTAANVTFGAGQTVGNLVTVGLGPDAATTAAQSFSVFNGPAVTGATVDFTADVVGYYAPQTATAGAPYVGLSSPTRIYDSRTGSGAPGAGTTLTNGGSANVTVVGGSTGVPITATGVVLNVAITNATAPSFISAYPANAAVPGTASQVFVAGETISSQVISGIGTGGAVTIANHAGNVDIVVDVDGYFGAQGGTGSLFNALPAPVRLTDTRPAGVNGGSSSTSVVQGAGATAGVLSIADVAQVGKGNFLTAYPAGSTAPLAANVNYVPGDTFNIIENAAYGTTGTAAGVNVLNGPSNAANANIVVDESGYFAPPSAAAAYAVTTTSPATVTAGLTGAVTYTASGLPATGTADVTLFPGAGVNAPTANTFTPPTGGGAAQGAGTTTTGNAFISSVNGVATTGSPKTVNGTTPLSGTITFVVTSPAPDSAIPAVFTGTTNTLQVNALGSPATGYAAGAATAETWNAPLAANGPTGGPLVVALVDPAAGTFQGCVPAGTVPFTPSTAVGNCFTYTYTNAGDTYGYLSPAELLTAAQFGTVLSGVVTEASGPTPVPGDELAAFNYNSSGPTNFAFSGTGTNGDVPAAPNAVGVVAGGTAGGVTVSWTAPANPDVASYNIFRATGASGGTFASIGTSTTTSFNDTTGVAGTSYQYEVAAVATATGGAQQGPLSTPFTFAPPAGSGATTPSIVSAVISASSTTGPVAGTALVTYNEAVNCGVNAGPAFSYSNSASPTGAIAGANAAGNGCSQTTGQAALDQILITFPLTVGTTAQVVSLPSTNDTLKYTAPATSTTGNAVFSSTTTTPQFALTQTITDSGNPSPITTTGTPPSNPLS